MAQEKVQIEARKRIAKRASQEAGKILLTSFGQKLRIKSKGDRDLVTHIDQRAETAIIKLIRRHFPQDGILSEESPAVVSRSGFRWIIDPIDGTHNFIHQIAIFGTSIALEFNNQVVLGLIYMPVTDELYLAQKGKGAFCNGRRLSVSKRKIKEATVIYDSSLRLKKRLMFKCLDELIDKIFNVRMFGSTVRSLSYVASGKVEAEIEFNDKVWDFAAGLLLVQEAGGQATDFQGRPWSTDSKGYIASNQIVYKDIFKALKGGLQQ
ncbi:MAG: inositol monophosphatase [Candidatus Omnitrophica bacterium]|nr:inositol monophosphatase [Candidatus Omnitrophota bacterium]